MRLTWKTLSENALRGSHLTQTGSLSLPLTTWIPMIYLDKPRNSILKVSSSSTTRLSRQLASTQHHLWSQSHLLQMAKSFNLWVNLPSAMPSARWSTVIWPTARLWLLCKATTPWSAAYTSSSASSGPSKRGVIITRWVRPLLCRSLWQLSRLWSCCRLLSTLPILGAAPGTTRCRLATCLWHWWPYPRFIRLFSSQSSSCSARATRLQGLRWLARTSAQSQLWWVPSTSCTPLSMYPSILRVWNSSSLYCWTPYTLSSW